MSMNLTWGALFDLDGTLMDSERHSHSVITRALAARGLLDPLRLSPGRAVTLAWRESDEAVTIGGGIGTANDQDRLWVVMPQHNPRALERELCRRTAA